jgi:hypothetical protein
MVQALSPLSSVSSIGDASPDAGFNQFASMFASLEQQEESSQAGSQAFQAKYQADITNGDANQAVDDILAAVKNGTLDRATAQQLLLEAGPAANPYGGGQVSNKCQDAAKAMGFEVAPGESQAQIGWEKFTGFLSDAAKTLTGGLI